MLRKGDLTQGGIISTTPTGYGDPKERLSD